jgi:hypothetical protein
MHWTEEALVKARGVIMAAAGALILVAYLISRFWAA